MLSTTGEPVSRYRAGRGMKLPGLVNSQIPAHRYKKADQLHVAIPNRLDRQFDVEQPNRV